MVVLTSERCVVKTNNVEENTILVFFIYIWLAVHHYITFLSLPNWYTNFLFIYTNYIRL